MRAPPDPTLLRLPGTHACDLDACGSDRAETFPWNVHREISGYSAALEAQQACNTSLADAPHSDELLESEPEERLPSKAPTPELQPRALLGGGASASSVPWSLEAFQQLNPRYLPALPGRLPSCSHDLCGISALSSASVGRGQGGPALAPIVGSPAVGSAPAPFDTRGEPAPQLGASLAPASTAPSQGGGGEASGAGQGRPPRGSPLYGGANGSGGAPNHPWTLALLHAEERRANGHGGATGGSTSGAWARGTPPHSQGTHRRAASGERLGGLPRNFSKVSSIASSMQSLDSTAVD